MAMNRIQFQAGLSLPGFHADFGSEAQCEAALEMSRWPEGFRCPGWAIKRIITCCTVRTRPSNAGAAGCKPR